VNVEPGLRRGFRMQVRPWIAVKCHCRHVQSSSERTIKNRLRILQG
jgi:hypothetical protein